MRGDPPGGGASAPRTDFIGTSMLSTHLLPVRELNAWGPSGRRCVRTSDRFHRYLNAIGTPPPCSGIKCVGTLREEVRPHLGPISSVPQCYRHTSSLFGN